MRISMGARRVLALVVGLVAVSLVALWTTLAGEAIAYHAWSHLALNVPISKSPGPRPDGYDRAAYFFYSASIFGTIAAAGLSAALLVLVPRPSFRLRGWLYLGFLALCAPLTYYNYDQHDTVLAAHYQLGLNFLVIVLSAFVSRWLSLLASGVVEVQILKLMALFMVMAGGVVLPALFTAMWALWKFFGLNPKALSFSDLGVLASAASAIIAGLNYRHTRLKDAPALAPPAPSVIWLPPEKK